MGKKPEIASNEFQTETLKQIAFLQRYLESGRSRELYAAINGVCNERTLRNWLADPEKAQSAPLVRKRALERIILALHDADVVSYVDNYRFSLREMRAAESSQHGLGRYAGTYNLYSKIPAKDLILKQLKIKIMEPFVPTFNFRILSDGVYRKCDGFIFESGGKVFFTGLSEYVNASIIVVPVVNPQRDPLKGIMTLQNKLTQQCFISSCVLFNVDNDRVTQKERAKLVGKVFETF